MATETKAKYMSHTPGPWSIFVNDEFPNGSIVSDSKETLVAEMGTNGQGTDELMANAHLIAAAPELLEALTNMLDLTVNRQGGQWTESEIAAACKTAQQAIAKAEGR